MNKLKKLSRHLNLRGGSDGDDETGDIFAEVKKSASAAVVNIEVTYPRDFGLVAAGSSKATGFIVDKENGIILSNKHVVQEGPCRAKGIFLKYEEIDLFPLYRDPVHDYGFFQFDPSQLKDTPLVEIELAPDDAKPGMKALLIGNNEGEKLTFIEATVSRLDRPAMQGLDLNTFYITTSDTSVGGSSGSPLLSKEGKAIAMMAAGAQSTSFFFPLQRVARALEYLKKKDEPPRGTLQIGFKYQTFEALLKRKSINQATVDKVKDINGSAEGLLVVDKNLPKGPGKLAGLESGDVLYSLNGTPIYHYLGLAEILDTFIGQKIDYIIIRHLEEISGTAVVQDHKEIEVDRMVEVSNAIVHQLQYEVAIDQNLPMEGVYVSKAGYMFSAIPQLSIIKQIGRKKIAHLEDFIEALKALRNGEIVSVSYQLVYDQTQEHREIITVDKRWYPFQIATRDDRAGRWHYEDIVDETKESSKIKKDQTFSSPVAESTGDELDDFVNSIVSIKTSKPFNVDGDFGAEWIDETSGLIVDKKLGLVVTSSESIPRTLADVQIVFNQSKIIPAKTIYISPVDEKPVSFLKYEPSLLEGDETVTVRDLRFSSEKPIVGEVLEGVGISNGDELERQKVKVESFRRRATVEHVDTNKSLNGSGVYLDPKTLEVKLIAIGWGGVLMSCDIVGLIESVKTSVATSSTLPQSTRILPVTFEFISLAEARINNLPDEWAVKLMKTMTKHQRKLIAIKQRMVSSDAYEKLLENDIVLAIDDEPVTLIREFFLNIQNKETITVTVLRDSEVMQVKVNLTSFSTIGTSRIIHFAGLIVQDPHPNLFYNTKPEFVKDGGVYITHKEAGSPAEASENREDDYVDIMGRLVFKVDEYEVRDLEQFAKAITRVKHREFVRLVGRDPMNGEELVLDIRLDLEYWKTRDMFLNENMDWESRFIEHDS